MNADFFKKTNSNHIKFVLEGAVYYEHYLNLIQNSKKSIHLQTYIFENDKFGKAVQVELKSAAKRGVQVYLLIDSVGSMNFSEAAEKELIEAGIYFSRFNKVQFKWLGQWGRRLHHKVLLVDNSMALIGGINVISTSYNEASVPHQLDFAVYVEGAVTAGLTQYCQMIYSRASRVKIKFKKEVVERKSDPDG